MIRLVSMDLDQTLLSRDKVLMGDLETFVNNCKIRSIVPVIATGRGFYSAKSFLRNLDIDIICNNGNLIRREEKGSIEYINPVPKECVENILSISKNFSVNTSFHINGYDHGKDIAILYRNDLAKEKTYRESDEIRSIEISSLDDIKEEILSTVFTGDKRELSLLKQGLLETFSTTFHYHLMGYPSHGCYMLEVLQSSGDKYHGVKYFADNRKIDMSEVLAIGDDVNDAMLLKCAGIGIAMKNAHERVKEVADLISHLDNDHAGALDILNKVLKFGD